MYGQCVNCGKNTQGLKPQDLSGLKCKSCGGPLKEMNTADPNPKSKSQKRRHNKQLRKKYSSKPKRWKSYQEYMKSPEWEILRARTIQQAKCKCSFCDENRSSQLRCVHRHWRTIYRETFQDLIVMCEQCMYDGKFTPERKPTKNKETKESTDLPNTLDPPWNE